MAIIIQDDGLNGWFWMTWQSQLSDGNFTMFLAKDVLDPTIPIKHQFWANIVECDFDGYGQQDLAFQSFTDASVLTSDIRSVNMMPVTFSGGGTTGNVVKFWGIFAPPAGLLVAIEELSPWYSMDGPTKSITVTPSFQYSSP